MKYIRAYFSVYGDLISLISVPFFLWMLFLSHNAFVDYSVYLIMIVSLAGPISMLINKKA